MTTNEFYKWRQVKKWHKKEKAKYKEALAGGLLSEIIGRKKTAKMGEIPDVDVGCVGPVDAAGENLKSEGCDYDGKNEDAKGMIDPGPFPKNIYDLGPVENFEEIFFPRSRRQDARKLKGTASAVAHGKKAKSR